jgi:hypothetical protein
VVVDLGSVQLWRRISTFPDSRPVEALSPRRVRLFVAAIVILVGFTPTLAL